MDISKFKEIAIQYKVIFFDAYGVLKTSKGVLPGVKEMINFLQENNIDFFILTNDASRGPQKIVQSYHDAGITEITEHKVISSGMLAKDYITNKIKSGRVAYIGTEASAHYIETDEVKAVSIANLDIADCKDVKGLVFLDDEGFDWQTDLNKTINLLRKVPMPVIVANTDMTYPAGGKDVAIAIGGLADMIEKLSRKTFIRFGKPDSQIFNFAFNYAFSEDEANKKDILMVGDSLVTDIIGGNKFGIDTCLVLTGNILPDNYELQIKSMGILPDYVCESVSN